MDAKIPATDWSDPDLDAASPEVLLTLHWITTNPDRNDCGAYRFSAQRFSFQTKGLDPSWHEKTLALLKDRFVVDGHWVLYRPFIQKHLQLTIVGKTGGINHVCKALTKPFEALTKPLQRALLDTYPDLSPVFTSPYQALTKPLQSPCQALCRNEALTKPLASPSAVDSQSVTSCETPETTAAQEGLGKGLASPYQAQEKRREEKSSVEKRREESGECEGGQRDGSPGALVPTEEEVLAYAAEWNDLARGWAGIPEAYALDWFSWRMTPKAGPWPRDWKGDLRRRFSAAVLEKRATPENLTAVKSGGVGKRLADLRQRLVVRENSPEEKKEIRDEIARLERGEQGGPAA